MIYSIGEALIDMIPQEKGVSVRYVKSFQKKAGGAPANVAAAVAKLGGKSAFISKVGNDGFGKFLVDKLNESGVDTSRVFFSLDKATGIIYVAIKEDGDREFCSSRSNSADLYLSEEEIMPEWFTKNDILHFCSVSLVEAPVRYAHIKALKSIIEVGGRVSFDINLRLMLWNSKEDCLFTIWEFMKYPDYLKVSDEEVYEIFNTKDYDYAVKKFFKNGKRLKFIILSYGDKGSEIFYRDGSKYYVPAYKCRVIDTTGAGDCFIGSILYQMNKNNSEPNKEQMIEYIKYATAASALQIGSVGAIDAIPKDSEVQQYMSKKQL